MTREFEMPSGSSGLETALALAKQGHRVIPYHWIAGDGICSCRMVLCAKPGAHPITEMDRERQEKWGVPEGKRDALRVFILD